MGAKQGNKFLKGTCKGELSTAGTKDLGVGIKAVMGYMYTTYAGTLL